MSEHVVAPWTQEQVWSLNYYQQSGVFNPFTCDGEGCEEILVATTDGWICPKCDYKQNWAHPFMADRSWENIVSAGIMKMVKIKDDL